MPRSQSTSQASKSQVVTQDLPFLRRYARALTGGQTSGDAYVTATLEAVVADPSVLDDAAVTAAGETRIDPQNKHAFDSNCRPAAIGGFPPVRAGSDFDLLQNGVGDVDI